jgi:hypothetical protein
MQLAARARAAPRPSLHAPLHASCARTRPARTRTRTRTSTRTRAINDNEWHAADTIEAEAEDTAEKEEAQHQTAASWAEVAEAVNEERATLESERRQTLHELKAAVRRGADREVKTASNFVRRVRTAIQTLFAKK